MKRSVVSCLLALSALMLAQGAHAKLSGNWHSCCKRGFFCCGDKCLPSWKKSFVSCPKGPGCCKPKDPCEEKPFVVGPCEALIPRYSFNSKTQQCEQFFWGGCEGNGNNFEKEADCIKKCDAKPPADCCDPGEKCCDDACIPDDAQTFAPCGKPKCCKPDECICTKEFFPVCNRKTNKQYGNKCEAECAGEDPDDLTKGPCPEDRNCCPKDKPVCCGDGCITKEEAPVTLCPVNGLCGCDKPDPGLCVCPQIFKPVCSKSTGKDYSNACEAGCAKDPGPFVDGLCEKKD